MATVASEELLPQSAFLIAGLVDTAPLQLGNNQVYKRSEVSGTYNVLDVETI
jgi:hypothetical protein